MSLLKSSTTMILLGLLAACGGTAPPPVDLAAEEDAIRERSRRWNEAVAAKDLDEVMSYYAPDAVQMVAGMAPMVGHQAIRDWLDTWLLDPTIDNYFAADAVEIASSGDLAYERGSWTFTKESPEGPVEDFGKYVCIWKKVDGTWYAALDISQSDAAPLEP